MVLNEHFINIDSKDREKKEKFLDDVKSIIEFSYSKIGGPLNINSYDELLKDKYFWKLNKKNDKIVACVIYKVNGLGRKYSLCGSDGTPEGKEALYQIMREDIDRPERQAWGEFSGAMEHQMEKFNGTPVPNTIAKELLASFNKPVMSLSDDGFHYTRLINGVPTEKIIYGNAPKNFRLLDTLLDEKESNEKNINEQLLLEKSRQELINKSKAGAAYAETNRAKGKNRWERRKYSRIANSVRDYNNINMNVFFKDDILEFVIKIKGETNDYEVTITFSHILDRIYQEVKKNNNKLEFKCVLRALLDAFNSDDIYVGCSCPDFCFGGFNYYSIKQNYNSNPIGGKAQDAPVIRNPLDNKGAACKHINLCLANTDWMMKIASVINNYIKYSRDNLQRNYADYIFPKIYHMPYNKAIQLSLFDEIEDDGSPLLPSDRETMKAVINRGFRGKDDKGKFTKGNEFRFQKKEEPVQTSQEKELPLFKSKENDIEIEEEN